MLWIRYRFLINYPTASALHVPDLTPSVTWSSQLENSPVQKPRHFIGEGQNQQILSVYVHRYKYKQASWVSSAGKETTCNAGDPRSIPGSRSSPGEEIGFPLQYSCVSLVAQMVKNPPTMQETWVWSLAWEDPLEEGMTTHSSILAWKSPWTEEPGRLQSMGSQSQKWLSTARHTYTHIHIHICIYICMHIFPKRRKALCSFYGKHPVFSHTDFLEYKYIFPWTR